MIENPPPQKGPLTHPRTDLLPSHLRKSEAGSRGWLGGWSGLEGGERRSCGVGGGGGGGELECCGSFPTGFLACGGVKEVGRSAVGWVGGRVDFCVLGGSHVEGGGGGVWVGKNGPSPPPLSFLTHLYPPTYLPSLPSLSGGGRWRKGRKEGGLDHNHLTHSLTHSYPPPTHTHRNPHPPTPSDRSHTWRT